MLHASDGGADGIDKLDRLLRRQGGGADGVSINIFASRQLDLALGRTNVIHAALIAGAASTAFLAKAERLTQFRLGAAPSTAAAGAAADANAAPSA